MVEQSLNEKVSEVNILKGQVKRLKSIDVEGVSYKIVFYLGGDLKFLNVVSGLDSCCCTYSCVFCKCPKQEFYDVTKTWSVSDQVYGARTIEKNEANSKPKKKKQAYNCAHAPLFKIPVAKTVPGVLHLFLRICDQLVAQLITELRLRDNIEKAVRAIDRGKCSNIVKFEEFVKNLGISQFSFKIEKNTSQFAYRDFQGPEHAKILESIEIREMIPDHPKLEQIEFLWKEFLRLINLLKDPKLTWDQEMINEFQKCACHWVDTYAKTYLTKDVTLYMHIFASHIAENLLLHGNLTKFCQQGLGKLNEKTTG